MTENLNRWWNWYYKWYQEGTGDQKAAADMGILAGMVVLALFVLF